MTKKIDIMPYTCIHHAVGVSQAIRTPKISNFTICVLHNVHLYTSYLHFLFLLLFISAPSVMRDLPINVINESLKFEIVN